jgi:hypothetical protein
MTAGFTSPSEKSGSESLRSGLIELSQGDPATIALYFTPSTRLSPGKAVADYFGTHIEDRTISIVLEWAPASHELQRQNEEKGRIATAEILAKNPGARIPRPKPEFSAQKATPRSSASPQATLTGPAPFSLWVCTM